MARILIVEDEFIVALDTQKYLEQLGYQDCGMAATGEDAIRLALATRPDLILMDIRLAGEMDGIDAASHIRAALDTPIIYITAYADQESLERAEITQPLGYITKPLEIRELHTAIDIALYRHALERRERQALYRFKQVFSAVRQGLILLDHDLSIEIANQSAMDYLSVLAPSDTISIGSRLVSLNGRPTEEFLEPTAVTPAQTKHEIIVEGRPERVFEVESFRLSPLRTNLPASDDRGWVVTIQDVTEARAHEQYVRQQERLAAVGRLAAGIAHDFGNILATISLTTQIIPQLEANLSPRSVEHLNRTQEQVMRAGDLIAQVLDFSRTSLVQKTTLDLVKMYRTWTSLLVQLVPENIQMTFSHPDVPCLVEADPTRMQQVVWNLVLNACDALPNGGTITVALDRAKFDVNAEAPLPELAGREWISIQVIDDGTGIAPEVLPHIFEPFFTTKSTGHGTGLGLAQVYGIVTQHAGLIHVASHPGQGTTFTLFWPTAHPSSDSQPAHGLTSARVAQMGNGQQVLVVEDNFQTRQALVDGLTALNYRVISASDGEQALVILHEVGPAIQLAVIDHVMPNMGAVEFCQELKRDGSDLPVIVLSGYAREDEANVLKQLGVVEYLRKPVSLDLLSQLIARVLNPQQGAV